MLKCPLRRSAGTPALCGTQTCPPGTGRSRRAPPGLAARTDVSAAGHSWGHRWGVGGREDALTHPRAPCLCPLPLDGMCARNPCTGPSLPGFTLPTVQGCLRSLGVQSVRGDTCRADLAVPCSGGARIASRRLSREPALGSRAQSQSPGASVCAAPPALRARRASVPLSSPS